MEKHSPRDLPPFELMCQLMRRAVSVNVLFKTHTGLYEIGFADRDTGLWYSVNDADMFWSADDIECWWYLPE